MGIALIVIPTFFVITTCAAGHENMRLLPVGYIFMDSKGI
jgi:hypothetical protein